MAARRPVELGREPPEAAATGHTAYGVAPARSRGITVAVTSSNTATS